MERIEQQILRRIKREHNPWTLMWYQDGRGLDYAKTIKRLLDKGVLKFDKSGLKARGKHLPEAVSKVCAHCEGKGISLSSYSRQLNKFKRAYKSIKRKFLFNPNYDQTGMRPQDTFARLVFADMRGDIYGRDLVFFGDDDLASIAALILSSPKSVTVIDIDKKLIGVLNSELKKYGCDCRALVYDVRNELPSELKRNFDTFVTEPLDNLEPLKVWLSRCAESLKGKGCAGYFGISYLEISPEQLFEIEKVLLKMGMVITDVLRKFSNYPWKDVLRLYKNQFLISKLMAKYNVSYKPSKDFYTSTLFRSECVTSPRPIVRGKVELPDFYVDEEEKAKI